MTRRTVTVGLACLATLLAVNTTWSFQGSGDLLGGSGIIPLNPDFSPDIMFELDPFAVVPNQAGFGDDIVRSALTNSGGLFEASVPASFAVSVQVQLNAALSQALNATNRPSVLTPYAGQIGVDPEGFPYYDQIGSLATNKATTIGKGSLGFGVSYQFSRFNEFKGNKIGDAVSSETTLPVVVDSFGPDSDPPTLLAFDLVTEQSFTQRVTDVHFNADVITLAITYGLLDRLDIGALIPYIFLESEGKIEVSATTNFSIVVPDTSELMTGTQSETATFSDRWEDHENGFGDVILFGKFQILSQDGRIGDGRLAPMDLAFQLEVKTQTGDEDEFLGTGDTDIAGRLLAQANIGKNLLIRGEAGGNYSGLDSDFSTLEYKAGLEWRPREASALALSAEIIGSHSHAFHTILDAVVGGRYVFDNKVAVFGGVRFPLNDNGLRFDIAPIVGVEYTFLHAFGVGAAAIASLPDRNLPDFEPMRGAGAGVITSTNVELDAPVIGEIAAAAARELPALPKTVSLPLAGAAGGGRD